ncbi:putative target of rapamycin (TOR) kinase 1 [Trypanosoma cruzi]|uniref:Putative target of rapamycin (TOR) kinase 1 n=1 Tax=Trypanosoma cruzi TaxID=5693 RepID=A0A2V2VQZ0_TRYCR|nr:putative target of rapamycin (TOR) kinase 1 [Trypanosoma cruzi]RNC44324.1 hypothetical protein TcCL_NonESM06011 [Trypanosoma cruzi]
MGYKAGPEILRIIITSAIAVVTTVAHRLWAAPPSVRADVWIDNIRIAGSKSDATLWEVQALCNADSCHASMGEDRESGAAQYTFLGVQFDHTHRAVSLSDKFVRSVCAMPALNSLTIAEMEVTASRFLYLAAILGTRLCDYYFFIKAVRRRLSALNRGMERRTFHRQRSVWARDCNTSSRIIVGECSSPQKRHRPPSSRTHRSMDGEPFSFQTPETLKLPEENGGGVLFYHAGRGARGTLGPIGLFRRLATHHGRLGGQYFAARSGE